ncbi:MAG: peptidase MA family metallohydrolase [Armatimonadota bacterium]|nr:peptidase MA family metallohydrolase [Armatimonadota bacterium]
MKNNRAVFATVMLILALTLSANAAKKSAITTKNFSIVYSPANKSDAQLVVDYAEKALDRVSKDLGYEAPTGLSRIPIRVYSSRPDFVSGTGIDKDRLVVGRAWSGTEQIEIDASGTYAWVEQVTAHEITHVVIARILGIRASKLPLWANEGIARNESNEASSEDNDLVGDAISKGDYIPLSQIAKRFPSDDEQVSLAYAEATSFMRYLKTKHGMGTYKRLLSETAVSGNFDKAVERVTGSTLSALEKAWRKSVSKGFSASWLGRNLPTVVGALMAILCVLAYKAIKLRQRWNSAKWLIEDSDDGLDYGPPPE